MGFASVPIAVNQMSYADLARLYLCGVLRPESEHEPWFAAAQAKISSHAGRALLDASSIVTSVIDVRIVSAALCNDHPGPRSQENRLRCRHRAPLRLCLSRQVTEAFPWDTAPRYLLRDHDASYGSEFCNRVEAMGITEVITAPRSPWQNGYVERLIGSIRRESLDHLILFDEAQLRRMLKNYASY